MKLREVQHLLSIKPMVLVKPEYYHDGWIATIQIPLEVNSRIDLLEKRLAGNIAEDYLIDGIMNRVQMWSQDGIAIYGFRPPAVKEVTTTENIILQ